MKPLYSYSAHSTLGCAVQGADMLEGVHGGNKHEGCERL